MGTLFVYGLGALVRVVLVLLSIPAFALSGFLQAPGIEILWGTYVWLTTLIGTPGEALLAMTRLALQIGVAYLPFYVARRARLRAPRSDTAHSSPIASIVRR